MKLAMKFVIGLPAIAVRQEKSMFPKTAMQCSIEKCLLGQQKSALQAVSKKRIKVQNYFGEVLTEESAMETLAKREMERQ